LVFDDAYVSAAEADFQAALAQKLTPEERDRVEAAAYPVSTLKLYLEWHKAMGGFEFQQAKDAYDAILDGWQKELEHNPNLVARAVPAYMSGLMSESTLQALKYSSAPYSLVSRIPEELPTALDPTNSGDRLNLQAPEINDSGWMKTHTYNSTWDAQGLGFYREGAVWYRVRFELPKEFAGKPVGLFLGGFEDEARVWINGKAVGSSGVKFANPAVFDLTGGIRESGINTLAIQIVRNSNMNENALGGLLRPSFLFTGPQVEASAKPGPPEYRILPGGGTEPLRP
jgi:hypothetical protein